MGVRKIHEQSIRKLTRLGRTSLAVTLPIAIVKGLKWKERQKVRVVRKGKHLIITDWKPNKR